MTTPINTVLIGDAAKTLATLPAASIDTVVTSPPYYSVRDYEVDGQLGLEASVQGWVDALVAVMDEVARVLKPTGSCYLNVADGYSRAARYGASAKSMLLGPERLLLALADRGWIVRSKITWSKTNPMPTPVTDRYACTWEVVYFMVRSPKYFFDLDAVRLPHKSQRRRSPGTHIPERRASWAGPLAGDQSGLARMKAAGIVGHVLGRNPGDSWQLATSNFRGGHHATFPEKLVERPLLASCPERVCTTCGEPWRRDPASRQLGQIAVLGELRPACGCKSSWAPGVVLDPFVGSGTTAVVAERLGRRWLGVELNPEFAALAQRRVGEARDQRVQAA